jgi:membrane protease YdiL (CAAX protease family)
VSGEWPPDGAPPPSDGVALHEPAVEAVAVSESERPAVAVPARRFGAARAIAIFALTFAAQLLASFVVIVVGVALAISRGEGGMNSGVVAVVLERSTVAVLLLSAVGSAAAVLLGGRFLARDLFRDRTASGIGRLAVAQTEAAWSLAAGVGLALIYGLFCTLVLPPDPNMQLGPLAKAAESGGASRAAWALLALVFAPIFEELLFRGIALRGFTESWGRIPAAIVVTVLFVSMHLFETIGYWPATVAITFMALAALGARLRTGSLAAAMLVHFGYNATIAAMALLGRGH